MVLRVAGKSGSIEFVCSALRARSSAAPGTIAAAESAGTESAGELEKRPCPAASGVDCDAGDSSGGSAPSRFVGVGNCARVDSGGAIADSCDALAGRWVVVAACWARSRARRCLSSSSSAERGHGGQRAKESLDCTMHRVQRTRKDPSDCFHKLKSRGQIWR